MREQESQHTLQKGFGQEGQNCLWAQRASETQSAGSFPLEDGDDLSGNPGNRLALNYRLLG